MILLQFNFNLCNTMASWTGELTGLKGAPGWGEKAGL